MITCYGCDYAFNMELLTQYPIEDQTFLICPNCLHTIETLEGEVA